MSTPSKSDQPLQLTPLHSLHVEMGGKMVPFTGYSLPIQYSTGIIKEHTHTREHAGLFDVSHMGQVRVKGPGAEQALETIIPIDLSLLPPFKQSYAVFTNEQGGIMDDLIITRWGDDNFFLVVNAACKEQDLNHLRKHLDGISVELLADRALVALQGPKAIDVINKIAPQAGELSFLNGCWTQVQTQDNNNAECFITRSGYTGEDGFEISIPAAQAIDVANTILAHNDVLPIGLGARDSLRLEAGLCLYGHDMDTNTTPIEAGLIWTISKSRRTDGTKAGGFLGSEVILQQIKEGALRKRVGFNVEGRVPVREGAEIINNEETIVGKITSGGFGATVSVPVAMGYVEKNYNSEDAILFARVRNKKIPLKVSKMPFVKKTYAR